MAQLVARVHGVHEVVGSNPATPTKLNKPCENCNGKTEVTKWPSDDPICYPMILMIRQIRFYLLHIL